MDPLLSPPEPSDRKEEPVPLLRGWLHAGCFFLALPLVVGMFLVAESLRARIGAAVYGMSLLALFAVSGAYHRGRWGPARRKLMKRLDHATIYVMIAGSYTPVCLLVLRGRLAVIMLAAAWSGAALGMVLAFRAGRRSEIASNALYIVLGWTVIVAIPQLQARLQPTQLTLIAGGGALFTIGAITLLTRWPNPSPRVFGYHEVWHVFVVAAVACQFVAIASIIRSAGVA